MAGGCAFGHLGYTGTAFWIDPDADRAAVLLTNRTWPDGQDRARRAQAPLFWCGRTGRALSERGGRKAAKPLS